MKWLERIIFYIILVAAIAITGALLYAKINDTDTVDLLDAHIAELESDKKRLIAELDTSTESKTSIVLFAFFCFPIID